MVVQQCFTAELRYFKDDPLYLEEKPYGFKQPNEEGPNDNIKIDFVKDVLISDIRKDMKVFNIEQNGFSVFRIENDLPYEDYHDPDKVQPYFRELELLLRNHLHASRVDVFRHAIRKRHKNWPFPLEESYDFDQPTTTVHIDATVGGCVQEMELKYGAEEAEKLRRGRRFQWFNFWKPIRAPPAGLNDWPLFICDSASVDKTNDLTPADLIYPTYATENTLVSYRPQHKWLYLGGQRTNEVIVFKQADSLEASCAGVPHCSGRNPFVPNGEPPRESIEVRALVFHDEVT